MASITLKISWRNLLRHKGKSLVIGAILFLGAFIMTAGNGVISGMDKGLQRNIVDNFLGDLVLVSQDQENESVLMTPGGKSLEIITDYLKIKEFLKTKNYVTNYLPVGRGFAMILNEEGDPNFGMFLGVNFGDYRKMFDSNITLDEGEFMKNAEPGVMINTESRKQFFDFSSMWFTPKNYPLKKEAFPEEMKKNPAAARVMDEIIIMGFSDDNTSLDVRLPVKAIYHYGELNKLWGHFNVMDIESYRRCFGYLTAADKKVEVSDEKKQLLDLSTDDLDSLFSESSLVENVKTSGSTGSLDSELASIKTAQDTGIADVDVDAGAYNMVFIKTSRGLKLEEARDKLNADLKAAGLPVKAITWKKAAGQIADMATVIRVALFVFVLFIFFVAIIIIMNTLSMAALERILEIGMMRAVGARKGFISRMFLYETGMLSFVFGGAGIIAGIIAILIFARLGITSDNPMLQLLFGGDSFSPSTGLSEVLLGIGQLIIVTVIAVIYPLMVARRITPLDAIARD